MNWEILPYTLIKGLCKNISSSWTFIRVYESDTPRILVLVSFAILFDLWFRTYHRRNRKIKKKMGLNTQLGAVHRPHLPHSCQGAPLSSVTTRFSRKLCNKWQKVHEGIIWKMNPTWLNEIILKVLIISQIWLQ